MIANGSAPDQLHDLLLPMERKFRSMANLDDGYDIVDLTTRWVDRLSIRSLEMKSGMRLLFTTDGLYRLIDVFGKYDAAALGAAAHKNGLAYLYNELRTLEADDPICVAFPRAKISDDVCAALVTVS